MDYNSLTQQVIQICNRSDAAFTNLMPDFIEQATNKIYIAGKGLGFQKSIITNTVGGTPLLLKPADWRSTVSMSYVTNAAVPERVYILERPYEFCQMYTSATLSDPLFWGDYNLNQANTPSYVFLSPTAGRVIPILWLYLSLPLFNATNSRNFLTDRHPSLLLYGTLLETVPFTKNAQILPLYQPLYEQSLELLKREATENWADRVINRTKV